MTIKRNNKHIASLVKEAVSLALKDFYCPPVPDPEVSVGKARKTMFYITEGSWKVHINVNEIPPLEERELVKFFRSICRHELGHYTVCPYDMTNSLLILRSVMKNVGPELAGFVANFFCDLIVDHYLFERYREETLWEKKVTANWIANCFDYPSELWALLIKCYEKMWNVKILEDLRVAMVVDEVAAKIVKVIKRGGVFNEKTWPRKAGKVAEIIRNFLEWVRRGEEASYDGFTVPEDVAKMMRGDPLKPPLGRSGDYEKAAEKYIEEGGRVEEFVETIRAARLNKNTREILRAWYRAKAKLRIKVKISSVRRRKEDVQVYPDVWRIEDPLEELDIPLSLQCFPKLIPGLTTKKWVKSSSETVKEKGEPPDMLIVLDSSSSMSSNDGLPFDLALVAAFSALKFAMSKNCRVAAINFSNGVIECYWTRDRVKVEDVLLSYQGGGTVLPTKRISKLVEENGFKVLVLIITDTGLANWDEAVKELGRLVAMGHSVCMFFIGGREGELNEAHRKFLSMGGKIYPIPDIEKLPDVVIDEVKGHYQVG
ncbi:MAG: hypothetical protein QXX87_02160 [Candidatus Jordarchaeales archaeon]